MPHGDDPGLRTNNKTFYNLVFVSLNSKLKKAVQESIDYIIEIFEINADVLTLGNEELDKD